MLYRSLVNVRMPNTIDEEYLRVEDEYLKNLIEENGITKVEDLTDNQIKAFRIADNKTAEFAEWDFGLLEIELEGLDNEFTGFDMNPSTFMPLSSYEQGVREFAKSRPKTEKIVFLILPSPDVTSASLPSLMNLTPTSGCESAILSTTPATALPSVTSFFKNFILAGVL